MRPGEDLGGGGGGQAVGEGGRSPPPPPHLPQGFDPLWYFLRNSILVDLLENFSKALWRQKVPKNGFLTCSF